MAAQLPAAYSDAAPDLRLIPDTDLAQLDPCAEHAGQVLYQLPEVDPSVCRKVEQYLIVVKCVLRVDELHVQPVLADLLLADTEGFFFLLPVFLLPAVVVLICEADDGLERLADPLLLHFSWPGHHIAELHASGSLHDHVVPVVDLQFSGREEVDLPCPAKSYSNHLCHICQFSFIVSSKSSMTRSKLTFALSRVFAFSRLSSISSIPS